MNVAEQYPPQRQADGRLWFRPERPAGTDFSQWGWTSDPLQAHPDYLAQHDAQTGGLHPEWMCGRDCSGCVSEGEGGGTYPPRVRDLGDPEALVDAAAFGVAYVAVQPPDAEGAPNPVARHFEAVSTAVAAINENGMLW